MLTNGKFRAAILVALMTTASPALAEHHIQLKNCRVDANGQPVADTYEIYNADDAIRMSPYMKFMLSSVGETKSGKCKGEGEGYCKVFAMGAAQWFHVQSSKTVFQSDGYTIREYSGLLDCNSEPSS